MEHDLPEDLRQQFLRPDGTYRITGEEIIGDVVAAFPKTAAVMLRYGLHCVGCSANAFDTVTDGARLHGIPDDDIREMIAEINTTINKRIETLEVTPRAAAKVRELRSLEAGKEDWPLRVRVLPGPCAFGYEMDFDTSKEGDTTVTIDGLDVLIDPESLPLLRGSSIDYVESAAGSGFRIDNPNAGKCGKN